MNLQWMASGLIVSRFYVSLNCRGDANSLTQLFPALNGVQLTSWSPTHASAIELN